MMPGQRRVLRPGVVAAAAAVTAVLAALRSVDVLVTSWWLVAVPAYLVGGAYLMARVETWADQRAVARRSESEVEQ